MEVSEPISPILAVKLVAIATSLDQPEKEGWMKCLPHCENLVKIGPIDNEKILF